MTSQKGNGNPTPWQTDRWFVSPWNYLEETTRGFAFPKRIQFHDVCLRDGEQQAGVEFTPKEKVKLATMLAEAGVHRIEAGMPAVSKYDAQAVRDIVKLKLPAEIFAFSRCMVEDVKRAVDTGVKGIVMEVPASEPIIQYAYQWSPQKAIDLSVEATRYAKSQGLYVVFFPIDASRAEMGWYLNTMERVATEGHMDALALVDTFGVLSPHAVSYFVRETQKRIKKPLETHFHMDFGMGVANTIIALAAGADVVHSTISGIGERAGNVPTDTLPRCSPCTGWTPGSGPSTSPSCPDTSGRSRSSHGVQPADRGDNGLRHRVGHHRLLVQECGHRASAGGLSGPLGPGGAAAGQGGAGEEQRPRLHQDAPARLRVKATDDQVNELVLRVKTASLKKKGSPTTRSSARWSKAVVKR
jgi:hypothetical protein